MSDTVSNSDIARALDLVSDAVIEIDAGNRIVGWNRAAQRIYGWSSTEAIGQDVNALLPSVFPAATVEEVRAAVDREGVWQGDVVHLDRKGQPHTVNCSITLVTDEGGDPIGKIAINRDVTRGRDAETAAAIERTRLERLVQHSAELIVVIDPHNRITYASPAVARLLGSDPTQGPTGAISARVHPEDLEAMRSDLRATPLTPDSPYRTVFRLRRADGSWSWVQTEITDLRDDPAVGGFVVNSHEITDRRQSELLIAGEADALEMIAGGVPLAETLEHMLERLRQVSPRLVAAIDRIGEDGVHNRLAGALDGTDHSAQFPVNDAFVMTVGWSGGDELAPNELRACRHVRHLAEMAIGRTSVDAELAQRAQRDPLTGVYNRGAFIELVGVALSRRHRGTAAVFAVGLDQFKSVNANFGHEAGDEALRAVAELLTVRADGGAIVGRASGDEFLVYFDELRDEHEAVRRATVIRQALAVPFGLEHLQLKVTASIGVAIAPDAANVTVSQLLRDADLAMHRAKSLGRDRTELFDDQLRARSALRIALETGLDIALAEDQFEPYYQPIVDIATGAVLGVEALIRWNHPEFGVVPPGDFIGVAEETGAIIEIGRWMIGAACRQAAAWRSMQPDRPVRVSVNLSALQLNDGELASFLSGVLAATELEPALLCLEITESVLMEDAIASIAALRRLKALGLRLAVDDFGTGYSSMAYLKRFPVDELKIDRSFVAGLGREPEDTAIVRAIIGLGDALGLEIIAEGVEEAVQAAELIRLGATSAQGYLWSHPLGAGGVTGALSGGVLIPTEALPVDALSPDLDAGVDAPDDVVAVIAHELRTPLTVISGYAEALELFGPDERKLAVASIRRNVARMLGVLDSFNALREIDQGSLALSLERVTLDVLLDEVVRDVEPNLRNHQLNVEPIPACAVDLDVVRIHQVIVNLLTNAAKYSPPSTMVTLAAHCGAGEVTISVADEGAGIPAEQVAVAFRKFGRLDRRSRGTGIGLYLARGFARAHGGDLVYRRAPGGGSDFQLTLPLAAPSA